MKEKMNCSKAKLIRIDEYLAKLGHSPKRMSSSGMMYTSMINANGDNTPSLEVSPDGKAFHDWSTGDKGSIIDLALLLLGTKSVPDALAHIAKTVGEDGYSFGGTSSFSFHEQRKGIQILSVGELVAPALLYYLKSRGIPNAVATLYCREVHYRTSSGKEYYSIGWPNDSGGWELRNQFSKIAAAPKDITVINDLCGCMMLVFEGFFDFLSSACLEWFKPSNMNAVVLNSTTQLDKALPVLASASRIICLLDNDDSGREATARIRSSFPTAEDHSKLYGGNKDVNEYLLTRALNNSK